ncbi:MAG: hypothetical protein Q7W05_05705, partial [Deltaproteobacteria bacterium]|nr:hypothetical protein [Deltaproteobacteria bacterium]
MIESKKKRLEEVIRHCRKNEYSRTVSYLENAQPDMFTAIEKRLNGKTTSKVERVMRTVNIRVSGVAPEPSTSPRWHITTMVLMHRSYNRECIFFRSPLDNATKSLLFRHEPNSFPQYIFGGFVFACFGKGDCARRIIQQVIFCLIRGPD